MYKNKFMNRMVNNIQLIWKLAYILKTYRICKLTEGFLKYELNNKLLSSVILLKVTPSVIWTQLIYIYIYNIQVGVYYIKVAVERK